MQSVGIVVRCWTCDWKSQGSIQATALSCDLGQVIHTLPQLPSSIIWYQHKLGSK